MTKAEEAAKEIYKDGIELFGRRDKSGNLVIHPEIMVGILRNAAARGYEQAGKDLAQDFHADTLIGDRDYEVIHTVAYGCGDEMHTTEISVETEMFKPGQKVKVIIVNDE